MPFCSPLAGQPQNMALITLAIDGSCKSWNYLIAKVITAMQSIPQKKIQGIVDLGIDFPAMIGEFHFGTSDAGLSVVGLEGVESQRDRGIAYNYYCESVATHLNGVGCHYFQCYDQFMLGRFDGENYNIGLFDICSCVYPEMMEQIKECSKGIYDVADGKARRSVRKPNSIPMVAY